VGLDPELLMFGVHSQMGPIFNHGMCGARTKMLMVTADRFSTIRAE